MEARSVIERPILFSAPMVRAILDGRKTVTRRLVKPQPKLYRDFLGDGYVFAVEDKDRPWVVRCLGLLNFAELYSPYGKPGDRLWVREPWRVPASLDDLSGKQIAEKCLDAGYRKPWCPTQYEADGARTSQREWREFGSKLGESTPGRYRHARFMPRWASRLTLELTGVRVERLQDISYADAAKEGAEQAPDFRHGLGHPMAMNRRAGFANLWEQLNGAGSWDANPWVWVAEFRRLEQEARAV